MTDRAIRAAIADGARSIEELVDRCGAGSRCGGCWDALNSLLAEVGAGHPLWAAPPKLPAP